MHKERRNLEQPGNKVDKSWQNATKFDVREAA